jgi:hypothetical protein
MPVASDNRPCEYDLNHPKVHLEKVFFLGVHCIYQACYPYTAY